METENQMYTTPEAAEIIGIAAGRLRTMIVQGKAVPSKLIGGTWMFTKEEIERIKNRPRSRGRRPKNQESQQ